MLKSYVCFDLETTGLDPLYNEIIEIGALKVRDGKVAERFMEFIHPQEEISQMITNLTGITNEMVANARPASFFPSGSSPKCSAENIWRN